MLAPGGVSLGSSDGGGGRGGGGVEDVHGHTHWDASSAKESPRQWGYWTVKWDAARGSTVRMAAMVANSMFANGVRVDESVRYGEEQKNTFKVK